MQSLSLQNKFLAATICMLLGGCVSNPVADTDQPTQEDVAAIEETVTDTVSTIPEPVLDTSVSIPAMPNLLDPVDVLGRSDIKGEAWLLEQDPMHATLQILSADSIDTVKNFLPDDTSGNIALFKKDGSYTLVYGIYSSINDARQDKGNLPSWIRDSFPLSLTTVIGHINNR